MKGLYNKLDALEKRWDKLAKRETFYNYEISATTKFTLLDINKKMRIVHEEIDELCEK
jgi:hypothetical protein